MPPIVIVLVLPLVTESTRPAEISVLTWSPVLYWTWPPFDTKNLSVSVVALAIVPTVKSAEESEIISKESVSTSETGFVERIFSL